MKNYELLAENTLSRIPTGSKLFGAPQQLRERTAHSRRTVWNMLRSSSTRDSSGYDVVNWQEYVRAGDAATAGGNYILNKSLQYRELEKDGRESRQRKHAFTERLTMALFGGIALIGPVLIMTLHPSQVISLVTISVATILFALCLAVFANSTAGKDVLAATAAYAAVLVVFLGTSNTSASSPS